MMLPEQYGSNYLSEDLYQKLRTFCRRYSDEESEKRYGVSHIVFACQLSLPLVITPELANVLWLNFSTFTQRNEVKKINRVVISDVLFSELLRPLSKYQFEFIPELRSYFLFLMKDTAWFNFHGITDIDLSKLNGIANFLLEFLNKHESAQYAYMSSFNQLNQWAAISYLNPAKLAMDINNAFKNTLNNTASKSENEMRQLRLYRLSEQFNHQINDTGISVESPDAKNAIKQLYYYTKANRNVIFKESSEEYTHLIHTIDSSFLGDVTEDADLLPISTKLGNVEASKERLRRKEERVRRVIPILVETDTDENRSLNFLTRAFTIMNDVRLEIVSPIEIRNSTKEEFIEALRKTIQGAYTEDSIFIYYTGLAIHDVAESKLSFTNFSHNEDSNYSPANSYLSNSEMKSLINEYRGVKNNHVIFIVNANVNGFHSFVPDDGIQISSNRELNNADVHGDTSFIQALNYVVINLKGQVTYRELIGILQAEVNQNPETSNKENEPVMLINPKHLDNYFLSGWRKAETLFGELHNYYTNPKGETQFIEKDFIYYHTEGYIDVYNDNRKLEIRMDEFPIIHSLKEDDLHAVRNTLPNKEIIKPIISGLNEEELNQLMEKFDGYSFPLYSFFAKIMRADFESKKNTSTIKIDFKETSINQEFEVELMANIINNVNYNVNGKRYHWVTTLVNLYSDLNKFSTYHFLLHNASSNTDGDSKLFNVEIQYSLFHNGVGWYSDSDTIKINHDWISYQNGQLVSKDLEIHIENNEKFSLFFDVYLLYSDFTIQKYPIRNNRLFPEFNKAQVTIKTKDILDKVLGENLEAEFKILISRDPIYVDFSQTGLKNVAHGTER